MCSKTVVIWRLLLLLVVVDLVVPEQSLGSTSAMTCAAVDENEGQRKRGFPDALGTGSG